MRPRILLLIKYSAISVSIFVIAVWILGWILFYPKGLQSAGKCCCENLQKIDGAKEQWALEHDKKPGNQPTWADLVAANTYLKKSPRCPQGGTYTMNAVGTDPVCSLLQRTGRWTDKMPWIMYYANDQRCWKIISRSDTEWSHKLP